MNNKVKTYDVVILTYAPSDILINSLSGLVNQTIVPNTILIYNTEKDSFYDRISDKNALTEIINTYSDESKTPYIKIINIKKSEFDHGKARNDAACTLNSEYILFLTDDATPKNIFLAERLINTFDKYDADDKKVAAVYARQIAKEDASLKEKLIRLYNYPSYDIVKDKSREKELGIKNYFCSNVCAMYDRAIFNKLGKFDENLILNEDTFYIYKAINSGYKVVYSSSAEVIHSHNYSYIEQFYRNFDIGVSQFDKKEFFENIKSEKEGFKLLKFVSINMIKGLHFISLIDFFIDCIYRFIGFRLGKKYKSLSIDKCIEYSNNKNYFIKKKNGDN